MSGQVIAASAAPVVTIGAAGLPEQKQITTKVNGWILNPAIDLIFCCGGIVWLLLGLHYLLVNVIHVPQLEQILPLIAIAGTHAFGESHTMATLVRIYRSEESRRQYAPYARWAALGCAALAVAALSNKI